MVLRRAHTWPGCPAAVVLFLVTGMVLVTGCATSTLDRARADFYRGRFTEADATLSDAAVAPQDRVLVWMERGTIRQALGRYAESCQDYLAAAQRIAELRTRSLSRDVTSLVVNDTVRDFAGVPYERTLLHAFTALNYLAEGNAEDAAVEARLIIRSLLPETRGEYPEDAFSRYMAGLCLELFGDRDNASIQYRRAGELAPGVRIDERGRISPQRVAPAPASPAVPEPEEPDGAELVCLVFMGRCPRMFRETDRSFFPGKPVGFAEIAIDGRLLGRSYALADIRELAVTTHQLTAAQRAAKTFTRLLIKEGLSETVAARSNEVLGDLLRCILIDLLERPDERGWQTLPQSLQVARVSCPSHLARFTITFRDWNGTVRSTVESARPLAQWGRTFFFFCRDDPPIVPSRASSRPAKL